MTTTIERAAASESLPETAPAAPAVAAPAEPVDTGHGRDLGRRGFRVLNRYVSVPLLRAGLGPWMGTPIGGWILLLRVRGRRSGLLREAPLSYLIADGCAWVMAGFGARSDWYRNLVADPDVEIVLPGRSVACRAEVVSDSATRRRIVPALVRATGVPAYMGGCDPFLGTTEATLHATAAVPLIRLSPRLGEPLVAGADDPGGRGWIWRQAVVTGLVLGLVRLVRHRG